MKQLVFQTTMSFAISSMSKSILKPFFKVEGDEIVMEDFHLFEYGMH